MLKLYKEQKKSIYELQNMMGLSKNTLYKYARKEVSINKMKANMLLQIAYIEKVEVNELLRKMKEYLK